MIFKPHEYQVRAIKLALERKRVSLFLDMGLGKSVIAATTAVAAMTKGEGRCLIVAPLRVAESTWNREFRKWDHLKHIVPQVFTGGKERTVQAVWATSPVHITNVDNFSWFVSMYGDRWPYNIVILDESTTMKSHSTARFKAAKQVLACTDYWINLSGTPTPQGAQDLWAQTYLLDQGERLGRNITTFRNRWMRKQFSGFGWELAPGAGDEILGLVADISISMKSEDYLTLPAVVVNDIHVDLPTSRKGEYKQLKEEMYAELNGEPIDAPNAAAASMKCRQFANGAVYYEDNKWTDIHDAKLDALDSVVEEAGGTPVLVVYQFESDLTRLKKRFPQGVAASSVRELEAEWNSGTIPMLFGHPASISRGLNLQYGGNILVWFGLTWNLEHYHQTNARLLRQGQERPVFVHRILTTKTVDFDMVSRLKKKKKLMDRTMERLK